ncbi:uncharacterized protein LOC128732893 [Sabethes cyaneus]|uniref:uncharacterized protein LOC128732893 n=1 Tax=Sabethes cyaneus TaxID=53552 RepID=UPI00237DAEE3|nr:uncharacterized protein LOC128732893 [Sabethes cyaneus]
MDRFVRRRSATEGRMNAIVVRVNQLDIATARIDELDIEMDSLLEAWQEFRTVHHESLDALEDNDAAKLAIQQANELEGLYNRARAAISDFRRKIVKRDSVIMGTPSTSSQPGPDAAYPSATVPELQLPKGILPTFSGDYGEWNSFYDLFLSSVHSNTRLTKAQKLFYLKTYTTGRAAAVLKHMKVEDSAYDGALEALRKRFDRKDQIVNHHLQRFLDIPSIPAASAGALRRVYETADDVVRALRALQREERDCWLIYLLLTRIDPDTRQQWFNQATTLEEQPTFEMFLTFLEQRSYAMETSHSSLANNGQRTNRAGLQRNCNSFVSVNSIEHNRCQICNEHTHPVFFCKRFKEATPAERLQIVEKHQICKNCLRSKHGDCQAGSCKTCKERHHTLLHEGLKGNARLSFPIISNLSINEAFSSVFLATAVVNVRDIRGKLHSARALLDSASQASFITSDLSKQLGLIPQAVHMPLRGISGLTTDINNAVEITFQSRKSSFIKQVNCAILPKISERLPHAFVDTSSWRLQEDFPLADERFNSPGEIDLLLGASIFYQLLNPERISLGPAKPVLQSTTLGWVVAGFCDTAVDNKGEATCFYSSLVVEAAGGESSLNQLVSKFWELENVTAIKHLTEEEQLCEKHYRNTTTRDTCGRYIVKLPFRQDPATLGETGYTALHQFNSLQRRMQRNSDQWNRYSDYISQYIQAGYASYIAPAKDPEKIVYLPHHGVLKEDSSTTKLRVVFNASQKSTNGLALNDILMTGPVVQDTLYNIFLNFRTHCIALTGDIEKMYLQIKVTSEDSKLIRMLWQEPGQPVAEYGMNTVTFGTTCAPYLATRTLQQLAEDEGNKLPIAKESIKDFYVDDCLTGANSVEEAITKRRQITALMQKGCFKIRKWASNNRTVMADIPAAERALERVHYFDPESTLKTLGVRWQVVEDLFTFNVDVDPTQTCFIKRAVLSTIAKIFDPLGLIGPVSVMAKVFMQELWKIDIDWDEALPETFNQRWRTFLVHLQESWRIKIPRRCIGLDNPTRIYLHGYCDASELAYGAVLYLRAIDDTGKTSSRLLCSKARVAPINRPTIPRLELCAAALLAQLVKTVKATLRVNLRGTVAWSDSTTTLAWIAGDPSRWKTFVANKVAEINTVIPAVNWRHIASEMNPADLLSRGAAPSTLASCQLWWNGPNWNPGETNEQSESTLSVAESHIVKKEQRKPALSAYPVIIENKLDMAFLLDKISSFPRMIRVLAWIVRFISNCQLRRSERRRGYLVPIELTAAQNLLVRDAQQTYGAEINAIQHACALPSKSSLLPLSPFIDGDLLRVGGRLALSNLEYEARHPIILPADSRLAELLFRYEHIRNHHLGAQSLLATIRRTYWIPRGRNLARKTVWNCVPCHRANPNRGMLQQIMGHLPVERTQPSPPFYITGVDYGGPITLVQRRAPGSPTTKGYIALFICFATRAVHLEAVSQLTTKAFLAALRRFVSRRGHCGHIYSDNGTNFVGAAQEMKQWFQKARSNDHNRRVSDYLAMGGTCWHFNPPGTPHMGGLWEAAIKSAKKHLTTITQGAKLTFEEFATLLAEIEAVLNSRPISPESSDPNDLRPLTPGHFLVGRPLTTKNSADYTPSEDHPYEVRFKYLHELKQHFWDRWRREYLPEQQILGKWHTTSKDLQLNDMVLIRKQKLPGYQWTVGRIIKIHSSPDGHSRLATVKTQQSELVQSVHNLSKLPI